MTDAFAGKPPTPGALESALHLASTVPGHPFHLQVNCTDQKGIRSFELFPGGATIWNKRSQVTVPEAARSKILETLVDRNFPALKDSYGGQGLPAKSAAPARVSCRIWMEITGIEKGSVQQVGGEQSEQLLGLAAELLDQVESYSDGDVTPTDLQDALDKLAKGQLAPQTLRIRFMDLPGQDNGEPGSILHLSGGQLSRQDYRPGQVISIQTASSLEPGSYENLLEALRKAELTSLPGNLWSEDQLQFEVQVLAHKKVILARRFSRLESVTAGPAQQRFDQLVTVLRKLARQD